MTEKSKNPEIRFTVFTDPWKECKLGEEVQIVMGQSPDGSTYTDIPSDYILVQGNADLKNGWVTPRVWTSQATKKAEAGDLIMSVRAPAGEMGKTAYNAVIGRGVAAIKGNEFIFQSLVKMNSVGYWKKLSSGSTFESLNSDNIRNAEIMIPHLKEQIRIGVFFQDLDNLINQQQSKIEKLEIVKKSMLIKMFSKEGSDFPEIRFSEFSDIWEKRKLEIYLDVSSEKNEENVYSKQDVLSVSGEYGILNQIEFQGRSFAGVSVSNYGLVRTGDIVYTKSPLNSSPYGIIKTNKGNTGIVSTLYAVYHPKKNTFPEFVQVYFEHNSRMNNYMHRLVNKGAKNDMKISAENALKGMVIFPQYEEQEVISKYFMSLDNLINLQKRKLEKLQNIKKSMLNKMFVSGD